MNWITSASHARWLDSEIDRTFRFGRAAAIETGFGWLDNSGHVRTSEPTQLWITARMVHVYSLATLLGRPDGPWLADHGIEALNAHFADREHGGWFAAVTPDGPADTTKAGYAHAFVVLGAAGAAAAERPGASALLEDALSVADRYFWEEDRGRCRESWDRGFTTTEAYRGGNANMHFVEAYLAAAGATGERAWLDRALSIARFIIHDIARHNSYRVNEHFSADWIPLPDYNKDHPGDRFRAFGGTPGHWMEWGRLLLHIRAELTQRDGSAPAWLLEDARGLMAAAIRDAWSPDGDEGFVYSVDWNGNPVVHERIRWVIVEALGAVAALYKATGEREYEEWYRRFWSYCDRYLIDFENGSWWQELDRHNAATSDVWDGKPDIYHLFHCLLVPRLPLAPALAPALARGLLDHAA